MGRLLWAPAKDPSMPMAELIERHLDPTSPSTHLMAETAKPLVSSRDPLRQAKTSLETADRRLKQGAAAPTDEVLHLLREATAHLERALPHTLRDAHR
jgi:hypothetical protein